MDRSPAAINGDVFASLNMTEDSGDGAYAAIDLR
jgi:hypothetical protein